MHIFRWLMSHPIITAWVLAALAILLNLNMGSSDEQKDAAHGEAHDKNNAALISPADHESGEKLETVAPPVAPNVPVPPSAPSAPAKVTEIKSEQANSELKSDTESQQQPEPSSDDQNKPVKIAGEATDDKTDVISTKPVNSSNPATTISVANNGQAKQSQDDKESSKDLDTMNSEELLQLAREAFWQNKKDRSAAIYQILIKREPESLAYKGEMANVYWHQNKQEESAALYAEIAMPMIKEGKTKEVANMLGFIGVFFPDKAREIHRSMTEK